MTDGQNENDLIDYSASNNSHHPCLPIPFPLTHTITITMNESNIHTLNDWYPVSICDNQTESFLNEYLFN